MHISEELAVLRRIYKMSSREKALQAERVLRLGAQDASRATELKLLSAIAQRVKADLRAYDAALERAKIIRRTKALF